MDAPNGVQDADFFMRQLDDLLAHLNLEGNISVMGYSMGGSITGTYTAANTHRVDPTFLIALAGFETVESD